MRMLGFFPSLSNLIEVSFVVALSGEQGAATRHARKIWVFTAHGPSRTPPGRRVRLAGSRRCPSAASAGEQQVSRCDTLHECTFTFLCTGRFVYVHHIKAYGDYNTSSDHKREQLLSTE